MPADPPPGPDEERSARRKAVADIRLAFQTAVAALGEREARRHWQAAAKKAVGKPPGSTRPIRDAELLRLYDTQRGPEKGRIVRFARFIATPEFLGVFGPNAGAIEVRLRRLLKQRAAEDAARDPGDK